MLSQQILPSRVLRQIEGGNEGRACIVIDVHFHIFNRARLDHRKVGFWILRRQKLPKCKLWLATVVIRVGLTLLMIPLARPQLYKYFEQLYNKYKSLLSA